MTLSTGTDDPRPPRPVALDEAIDTLGELVSRAGGEGYEALEVVMDFICEHTANAPTGPLRDV